MNRNEDIKGMQNFERKRQEESARRKQMRYERLNKKKLERMKKAKVICEKYIKDIVKEAKLDSSLKDNEDFKKIVFTAIYNKDYNIKDSLKLIGLKPGHAMRAVSVIKDMNIDLNKDCKDEDDSYDEDEDDSSYSIGEIGDILDSDDSDEDEDEFEDEDGNLVYRFDDIKKSPVIRSFPPIAYMLN